MPRMTPIPLADRRCTKCGRGVADGATFYRRTGGGPGSYRPVCADCGQARVAEARAEHGSRYGKRPPQPASSPRDLTPRQRDVLALLARGLDDKQIARCLAVSAHTVRDLCGAVYARMPPGEGNNYRVRAALWWVTQEVRDADG